MNARQIDDSEHRLHELRVQGIEDLALACVAIGLSLTATQLHPALAMPLLIGALGVGYLGVRAVVLRSFIVEDLAGDRDAYVIPAVEHFAQRATTSKNRHELANSVRGALTGSSGQLGARFRAAQVELEELVSVLEDDDLPIDPCSMVLLERWLRDPRGSFRNPTVPPTELRSRLRHELDRISWQRSFS